MFVRLRRFVCVLFCVSWLGVAFRFSTFVWCGFVLMGVSAFLWLFVALQISRLSISCFSVVGIVSVVNPIMFGDVLVLFIFYVIVFLHGVAIVVGRCARARVHFGSCRVLACAFNTVRCWVGRFFAFREFHCCISILFALYFVNSCVFMRTIQRSYESTRR